MVTLRGTSLAMFRHLMYVMFQRQQVRSWSALQRADSPCSKAISCLCSQKCKSDPHRVRHLYAHTTYMMSECFSHFHKSHGTLGELLSENPHMISTKDLGFQARSHQLILRICCVLETKAYLCYSLRFLATMSA